MTDTKFWQIKRTYLLKGSVQNYEWGEKGESAFIPDLLGFQPETGKTYAELWIGMHPKAPSELSIEAENYRLDHLIKEYPEEILGKRIAEKFEGKLPFLLKVLSAAEALSIQAHPDKEKARILHAKDPVNYPDDNHKPEIAIALDRLEALVGFNTPEEVLSFVRKYEAVRNIAGENAAANLEKSVSSGDSKKAEVSVRELYEQIMIESEKSPEKLRTAIFSIKSELLEKTGEQLTHPQKLFISLEKKYGNDVGLLSLFLLKYFVLAEGESVFLEAGIPHAYLKGNIIECMANSDNVVRAGLTPKYKDINSLLYILSPVLKNVEKAGIKSESGYTVYSTPAEEFEISRYCFRETEKVVIAGGEVSVFIVINGKVKAETENHTSEYSRGDVFMIPAAAGECALTFYEGGLAFRASVPD